MAAAAAITQDVQAKKIDPANLVIMVGENHSQLPIALFEHYFMRELKTVFNDLQLCDEKRQKDKKALHTPSDLTLDNLSYKLQELASRAYNPFYYFNAYSAALYKIDYRPIDMNVETAFWSGHKCLNQPFKIDIVSKYKNNPVMLQAYKEIKKVLPLCSSGDMNVSSNKGKTIRDLFMADKIMTLPHNGPVLTINGAAHLTDTAHTGRLALQEMVLAAGKDIYTIQLAPQAGDIEMFQREQKDICARMQNCGCKVPHASVYIQTPAYGKDIFMLPFERLMALNAPPVVA